MLKNLFIRLALPVLILSVFSLNACFAQSGKTMANNNFYAKVWEKVDSLAAEGFPKKALKEMDEVYKRALKEKNTAQQVKVALYRMTFQSYLEEEAFVGIIQNLQKEIASANYPAKQILHSILAQLYWKYYENNRYRFYNRSTTLGYKSNDLRTWDLAKIVKESIFNYHQSLREADKLKNTPVDILDEVLVKGNKESRKLRPTLYDFLAHRAIDFFQNEESGLHKPAYAFELDKPNYFSAPERFTQLTFTTQDTLSLAWQALRMYQDLLSFHLTSKNIDALADADLNRLFFVRRYSILPEKDTLYLRALERGEEQYKQSPVSTEFSYQLADLYREKGKKYKPLHSEENRWELKKAFAICAEARMRFPSSLGAQKCANLQSALHEKTIELTLEKVNTPAIPFKSRVAFKNIPALHLKVFKLNQAERDSLARWQSTSYDDRPNAKMVDFFAKISAVRQWKVQLPNAGDYQTHSAEFKVEGLPLGSYLLLASADESFELKGKATAYALFQTSNLSYVSRGENEKEKEFLVVERQSGKPLPGVNALVYQTDYYYKQRGSQLKKSRIYESDKNGFLRIPPLDEVKHEYFGISFFYRGDTLFSDDSFYQYYYPEEEEDEEKLKTVFFTDRAIYRPGQTVFFKGLMLDHSKGGNKIVPHFETTVSLEDVNGDLVEELELQSNEFGTFSGKFIIPSGLLNGEMRISDEYGEISISVEEYKRPTFEVKIDTLKEAYRLGDSVTIRGVAKAFSGAVIDAAKVSYRVVRETTLPYWYYSYLDYFPSQPSMEISNGLLKTNEKGEFTFSFKAIADKSLDSLANPIYTYTIYADVTDRNGETRSSQEVIRLAYTSLQFSTTLPVNLDGQGKKVFTMHATNLQGESVPVKGIITISRLQSPERLFRKQLWDEPDQKLMSREEFYKAFPYDVYGHEDKLEAWQKEKEVWQYTFDTKTDSTFRLAKLSQWKPGYYLLEAKAQNEKGEVVKQKQYVYVYASNKQVVPLRTEDWVQVIKREGKPGENAIFHVGNGQPNTHILYEVEIKNEIVERKWLQVDKKQRRLLIPIEEKHRGNFAVHFTFVQHGRVYTNTQLISVPLANTKLRIDFLSFRNKLLPGQPEEWKLSVKSTTGEKVIAEMVATLYDASLDAFRPLNWIDLYTSVYETRSAWEIYNYSFTTVTSRFFTPYYSAFIKSSNRSYDRLNWFGFNYFGGYNSGYRHFMERKKFRQEQEKLKAEKTEKVKSLLKKYGVSISGTVISSNDSSALPGVNVAIAGTNIGTTTDTNGKFSLRVFPDSTILEISLIGYQTVEVEVGKDKVIAIELVEGTNQLQEVVVTGYGIREKKELTGAISSVTVSQVAEVADEEVDEISFLASPLEGKVRGLNVADSLSDSKDKLTSIKTRSNFNETAFFYPHLQTDEKGEITINFTLPESLTRWKMMGFAHTKEFNYGSVTAEVIARKEVMVTANAPRFLREGDQLYFTAKVANLSEKDLSGKAQLKFFDALTMLPVDSLLKNMSTVQDFSVGKGQSTGLSWTIAVPEGIQAITYRLVATSGEFSDGEEMTLPVLTNRLLVTETLPLSVRGKQTKTVELEKLTSSTANALATKESTLRHERLTLEFTTNPAWYAMQALPYLMEYPYECAEQVFSRYYANALATHIANANPSIKSIFESWLRAAENGGEALLSNLEKNKELKSVLLEETPWVMAAKNESERKKRLGFLFDLVRMNSEKTLALTKLEKIQTEDGGFPWFSGMSNDRYITQYIVSGMGHLRNVGIPVGEESILNRSIAFADYQIRQDYERLKKNSKTLDNDNIGPLHIHYLYARSFFRDKPLDERNKEAVSYFKKRAASDWLLQNPYLQGMIALALHRNGDKTIPAKILLSLKDRAQHTEEMGMYWKSEPGYYWHQSPVETQALLIEAFDEIADDQQAVEAMKIWLLKQKQTQHWSTTKATAQACYALLLKGNWLAEGIPVEVRVGEEKINLISSEVQEVEAGTGYTQTVWMGDEVKPQMGKVSLSKKTNGVAWGALYWQYFERLDKITPAATPLSSKKKLFLQQNTPAGPVITPVDSTTLLKPGDLIKVRIELRSDRPLEYVHMKDMRASGLEPVNVLSGYKYQDGLGYYESTKDAATNFFFAYLPKGTFVFEYDLRVTHQGNFSNGITTIQCMYAPEFTSHSEGIRLEVK